MAAVFAAGFFAPVLASLRLVGLLVFFDLTDNDRQLRERLQDLRTAAAAAGMEALQRQVLADIGFGDDQLVDVEVVVVLGIGNGAHHALGDIAGDALGAEFEFGKRLSQPSCRGSSWQRGSTSAERSAAIS